MFSSKWPISILAFGLASCGGADVEQTGWIRLGHTYIDGGHIVTYLDKSSIREIGERTAFWIEAVALNPSNDMKVFIQDVRVNCSTDEFEIVKGIGQNSDGKVLLQQEKVAPLSRLVPDSPISDAAQFACNGEDDGLVPIKTTPLADADIIGPGLSN